MGYLEICVRAVRPGVQWWMGSVGYVTSYHDVSARHWMTASHHGDRFDDCRPSHTLLGEESQKSDAHRPPLWNGVGTY